MVQDNVEEEFKKIREEMLKGNALNLNSDGSLSTDNQENGARLKVPKGKLADFYWYENFPGLLEGEKKLMNENFPNFQLETLGDGKLMWKGTIKSNRKFNWTMGVIYQNDHPNNSNYGGSIRIYSIMPDLNSLSKRLGGIPHTLADEYGNIFICTARKDDFKALKDEKGRINSVTSAVSALAWASKWIFLYESWIFLYESWIFGEISKDEFASHKY